MPSSQKKHSPSTSAPQAANGLASQSMASQQLQSPTKLQSRSHSQSAQQTQQSQPLYPWSAHTLPSGQWPSPFPRFHYALSTTATAAGELFLFGGYTHNRTCNDLYVISTRDFSTTLLQTSGDVPSPRYGHDAVLTSTIFLIWGGMTKFGDQDAPNQSLDDSFYLLNLVSREWTRIVVDGPGPGGRFYHTMTLVGSKLFVFGGRTAARRCLNDIWALDLNCLKSNPFWESYEPAPGNEKPLPRAGHVSVTTGDRIITFGGARDVYYNDTWSFEISTRKWTELQCAGSIPHPRASHAAVLADDVMYVYGGRTAGITNLGDLTAFNLSTQRWTAFQDIGPSPCGMRAHVMASDGRRVFVLGGEFTPDAEVDEAKLIHVLDTKLLIYPKPDSNTVRDSEKTTQLAQKLSTGHPTRGQPQLRISSLSYAGAAQGVFPLQIATSEDLGHSASPQITRERNLSPNGLPSQPTGVDDKPRCVPHEDDDSEGSTEHPAKLVAPDTSSEKEVVRLEHERRLIELERELLAMRAAQTERDRRIAQLTDQLVHKSALLEQAEAKVAVALEQRELQAKLDELSRDQALEQAQSASQKTTSCTAEANKRSQREFAEVHAKLEAGESELAAVRLRLTDAEDGWAKSKAEADTLRAGTQTAVGLVNMDVDRVMTRLMERMRAMETEVSSLRGNEKSIESMECRNEG